MVGLPALTEARIVLDAYPQWVLPARVSLVADKAQFTPKTVETRSERDKLMFRVRIRIDAARSRAYAGSVRSGMPGVAYVKFDSTIEWPERLQGTP